MPFGLTNAPTTFNCMVDMIFCQHRAFVGTFFDDMIIFSKTEEEHQEHLATVFEDLRHNRLVVNGKKSEFFLQEIHFLGHIMSKDGVRMDPAKVEAIVNEPDLRGQCMMCVVSWDSAHIIGNLFGFLQRLLHHCMH